MATVLVPVLLVLGCVKFCVLHNLVCSVLDGWDANRLRRAGEPVGEGRVRVPVHGFEAFNGVFFGLLLGFFVADFGVFVEAAGL